MTEAVTSFSTGVTMSTMMLVLAVMTNYVGETLSCDLQKFLTHNMIAKQVIIIFLIYFTLNFTDHEHPHPIIALRNALVIWILFVIFGKTRMHYSIAAFIIFVVVFVIETYKNYHYNRNISDKDKDVIISRLNRVHRIALLASVFVLLIGFVLYFLDKKKEHGKNFNFIKFIFGTKSCSTT
tara:strand:- start:289 stop:831 length:543 start_codon:yes stop_codon:yes gene_type:complete